MKIKEFIYLSILFLGTQSVVKASDSIPSVDLTRFHENYLTSNADSKKSKIFMVFEDQQALGCPEEPGSGGMCSSPGAICSTGAGEIGYCVNDVFGCRCQ